MKKKTIKYYLVSLGAILIFVGLCNRTPGLALTYNKSWEGTSTTYYDMQGANSYSAIDEYVGGDAYNYIIGASLIAGKYAGVKASQAIYICSGSIILSMGLLLIAIEKEDKEKNDSEKIVALLEKMQPKEVKEEKEIADALKF